MTDLIIVGGGLAGSEAAWQAAQNGCHVILFEMRPKIETGAHVSEHLAELVCSNSLGSNLPDRASGLLKEELRRMGSFLLKCAEETALPAGGALAVDREQFSQLVTKRLTEHPNIEVVREEVKEIPNGPTIIASGPLTSSTFSDAIGRLTGKEHLFFYDAIAPIVQKDSINFNIAFLASRYDKNPGEGKGDYINCPLEREEYENFIKELISAERIEIKDFEQEMTRGVKAGAQHFFEGCLPIEILAGRGLESLAFGPMRPVGLRNPRTNRRPFAVVQLRQDNLNGSLYNLVGFQTNLKFPEQKRVLQLIPGLEQAEFVRYGQMHRNTFIASPELLLSNLQYKTRPGLFFAGQIIGVEGYMGNIATGLLAGLNAVRYIQHKELIVLPETTMLGALVNYITHASLKDFQPMKSNFGILPPLDKIIKSKHERGLAYSNRAIAALEEVIKNE